MERVRASLAEDLRRLNLTPAMVHQLVKYGVTGVSAVATDYGTFSALYGLAKAPLFVATTCSLFAGFIVSFLLNRAWVFDARKGRAHKRVELQVVLYVLLLAFNTGFTYLFIAWLRHAGVSAYVGKLFSIGIVMVWNYVAYKKVIFRVTHDENMIQ
jgi:putative flippase GtrA